MGKRICDMTPEEAERHRAQRREYYAKNRERRLELNREHNAKNRARIREQKREYRAKPEVREQYREHQREYRARPENRGRRQEYQARPGVRERIRERQRKWYAQNRARILEQMREYNAKNRARIREQKREYHAKNRERRCWGNIKRKYSLSKEDWLALHKAQGGSCPICGKPLDDEPGHDAVVDHCHDTGKVRGIVHRKCNVITIYAAEHCGADDLLRAMKYVAKHRKEVQDGEA